MSPELRVTQFTFTLLGQPYQTFNKTIQSGPLQQQAYTADGLRASLTDANGNTTSFTYDRFDRPVTTTYPLGSTEGLAYDADSNVVARTTRAGATIAYAYDTLNRLCTKTIATTPTACGATPGAAATVLYSYDLAGRQTGVKDNSAAFAAVPSGSLSYATTIAYDALNRPTGITFGDVPAATAPATASSVTFGHSYNAVNQRTGQTVSDNAWIDYPPATASTTAYSANALNQYTAVGAVTPGYDSNGNTTSDGTHTLGYDAENRLVLANKTGMTATYTFDGRGRRKTKTVNGTTTVFVTDADNREVLEFDGSTGAILRWYAYGLGSNDVVGQVEVPGGTRLTPVPDLQGSIIGTMSNAGTLASFAYRAYGASASAPAQFAYTGQRIDGELGGAYYYRARHYSTRLGRFWQNDPVGYAGGRHLYAYVFNDPLNLIDPLGLDGKIFNQLAAAESAQSEALYERVQGNPQAAMIEGGVGLAVVLGIPLVAGGVSGLGAASTEATSLFRAVNPAELGDLTASGGAFRNILGIENKYFATTAEGAASYARQTFGTALYEGPYTVVRTSIPTSAITPIMRATVDRGGISAVTIPTELLPRLSPATPLNFMPLSFGP